MRNIIPLYPEPPAIEQRAEEYDRKECIALNEGTIESDRKLAQWLLDHTYNKKSGEGYTDQQVAGWLGCGKTRINDLRRWASGGFQKHASQERQARRMSGECALKTNDNFQDDTWEANDEVGDEVIGGVADSSQILKNLVDSINDSKATAEAYRRVLKVAPFDSEEKAQIYNAITNLIAKWQRVRSTLDRKGHGNGEN